MTDITIITPHRDRTQQLSLVIACINNQTVKPDKWIIVDDGKDKVPEEVLQKSLVPVEYVWYPRKFERSSSQNSLFAMQRVTTNICIVIQDDDYYPPTYIQTVSNLLRGKQNILMGNLSWYIYRLSTGHYVIRNGKRMKPRCGVQFEWHSSAFIGKDIRQKLISHFSANMGHRLPPDLLAQYLLDTLKIPVVLQDLGKSSCVSLKDYGVGHPGWMSDHRRNRGDTKCDTEDFSVFKSWLGEDWKRYQKYLGRSRQ